MSTKLLKFIQIAVVFFAFLWAFSAKACDHREKYRHKDNYYRNDRFSYYQSNNKAGHYTYYGNKSYYNNRYDREKRNLSRYNENNKNYYFNKRNKGGEIAYCNKCYK